MLKIKTDCIKSGELVKSVKPGFPYLPCMKNLFLLFTSTVFFNCCLKAQEISHRELPVTVNSGKIELHGSLTLPNSNARKLTVCLIISGSGPTDRDGNNPYMKNESLKLLAYALADSGIASLRYDKRGVGESTISDSAAKAVRFGDFIRDAEAWIDTLKKDPRFNRIVVAGHSEGSLIGMIAAQKKVDGFISIAGAGKPASFLLKDQISANLPAYATKSKIIIDSLVQGYMVNDVPKDLYMIFSPEVMPYLISWFRYDPATEISKLNIPALIVQGDADLQVTKEDADLLTQAKKGNREIIIPEMNHVLKKVKAERSDNLSSYSDSKRPLHLDFISPIVSFINSLNN